MKMILIVEDNTDINNMIYDYLCKKQFECVQAFSGTEALLYLNSSDFDIIILDLMLPGINGNELIEKVKPEIKTPIIILSAKDELDTKVNSLMLGADDYITKPFELEELYARISVQLQNQIRFFQSKKYMIMLGMIIILGKIKRSMSTLAIFVQKSSNILMMST